MRLRAWVVAGVSVGLAHPAQAWNGLSSALPVWTVRPSYALHSSGSADLGFASSEEIVRRAMGDWARVSCTSLRVDYLGPTDLRPTETDEVEVIGWVETNWFDSPLTIGVTSTRMVNNEIASSQMALNGVHYTWNVGGGSGGQVDTYSIVLHEGGHFLGLGHSSDPGAAMFPAYSGGLLSINGDDEAGICTLYPGNSDCMVAGCPIGLVCEDGSCIRDPEVTSEVMCTPCVSSEECGPTGACLNYPNGAFCGTRCTSNTECLSSDTCLPVSDGSRLCVRTNLLGQADCTAPPPVIEEPEPEAGMAVPQPGAAIAGDEWIDEGTKLAPLPSIHGLTGSCQMSRGVRSSLIPASMALLVLLALVGAAGRTRT